MKNNLSFVLLLFLASSVFAQGQKKERVKAFKVQFINEHLALTGAEKEKFWPIYDQFSKDRKALHKNRPRHNEIESMSDAELTQLIESQLQTKEQMIVLQRKLYQDLKQVIPLKKIVKLHHAEKKFRHKIAKKARKHHRKPID